MKDLDTKVGDTGVVGEYFYRIETREGDDFDTQCRKWFKWQEKDIKNAITPLSFPSCPCSIFQADFDSRFFGPIIEPFSPNFCYLSSFPNDITSPVEASVYQKCCYSIFFEDFGALVVSDDGGSLEVVYSVLPEGELDDITAKQICCYDSNNCDKFYEVRPADNCAAYRTPRRRK